MNKLLVYLCICFLLIGFSHQGSAQKVNQRTLYLQAHTAFENRDYTTAFQYISQLKRVYKNEDYLRLKILSHFNMVNLQFNLTDYQTIVSLKEDVDYYLNNFSIAPDDEIKTISSRLEGPAFEPFNAYMTKGNQRYHFKDYKNALMWFEKADSIQPENTIAKLFIARIYRQDDEEVKDYEKSFALYKGLAEQGNAEAQNNLAWMYTNGKGVDANPEKGIEWNLKAAEEGNLNAQYIIATHYVKGEYLPKNDSLAFHWHQQAALRGYQFSQLELADMYYHGAGVETNQIAAVEWYNKAADLGNLRAKYILGWIYENGRGADQDMDLAMQWYEQAAEGGNTGALYALARIYDCGTYGINKNDQLAETFYIKAAELGHLESQNQLGVKYAFGNGVENDKDQALYWLEKAADQGSNMALNNLATIYLMGDLVEKDEEKAKYYIQKPVQEQYEPALLNNALMYAQGTGYEKDEIKAFHLIKALADQDNARAIYRLAFFYEKGTGTAQNTVKAKTYFEKAAALGNPVAYINISQIYEKQGNMEMAKVYLQKGIDQGVSGAKHLYGRMYYEGKSVKQSYKEALRWNNSSGCAGGIFDRALQHYHGKGTAPDTDKALKLVKELIETNENFVKELYSNVSEGGEIHTLYPNYAVDALAFFTFLNEEFDLDLE